MSGNKYKILIVMLTISMIVSMISACSKIPSNKTEAGELKNFSSYEQLTKLIHDKISDKNNSYGMWRNILGGEEAAQEKADMAANDSGAPSENNGTSGPNTDYSKTNLQVEGVDEADIIKTDGDYLYIVANGRFIIADVRDPSDIRIVSETKYFDDNDQYGSRQYPVELFLDTDNKLATLILYTYDGRMYDAFAVAGSDDGTAEPEPAIDYYGYWGEQNVKAQIIDVSDPAKPEVKREFSQEGSVVSARRIGNYVYIITNKYIYFYTGEDGKELDELVIPAVRDSAGSDEWEMLPVDSIMAIDETEYANFMVVTAIDTTSEDQTVSAKAVLGGGHSVYASLSNIYIASTRYTYENSGDQVVYNDAAQVTGTTANGVDEPLEGSEGSEKPAEGDKAADSIVPEETDAKWEIFTPPSYEVFTDIYRFSIDGGTIDFSGSGEVPGYILNQFAMDEYQGHFRIATTTGETWRTDEFTSVNNVFILDEDMAVKGKLEGLASTETIKSIRFMGDKAYMVTFRTTDPLFVLDLSDPASPEVRGELKIPGYSAYLHPVSENILLGFGKDAEEVDGGAIEKGVKVSVFDVTDISDPKEISTFILGDRGTYSDVLYNHKALLYSAEKNVIGFPITIYDVPEINNNDMWSYGVPVFSGFVILGLTEDNKLFEKGRVAHIEIEVPEGYPYDGELKNEDWAAYEKMYSYSYMYAVKRGLFSGDTLFTVSDYIIKANSLDDFSDIGEAKLPGFDEMYGQYYGIEKDSRG